MAGLAVLQKLPVVRFRSDEVAAFMTGEGTQWRGLKAWKACFDLVRGILVGLPEYVLNREGEDKEGNRIRQRLRDQLGHDRILREALWMLAWNLDIPIHPANETKVRGQAWSTLLDSLPVDDIDSFLETGISGDQGRLAADTLRAAARLGKGEVWSMVATHWTMLFDSEMPADRRALLLDALAEYFVAVRPSAAIHGPGDATIGPVMALALDHKDPAVCRKFRAAIHHAGFAAVLDHEELRRTLLNTSSQHETTVRNFFDSTLQAIHFRSQAELAEDRAELHWREALSHDFEAQLTALKFHAALAGYLLDLRELKEELAGALQICAAHDRELMRLTRQIEAEVKETRRHHEDLENLVTIERKLQKDIETQKKVVHSASAEARKLREKARDLRRTLSTLPSPPDTGDPAAIQQAQAEHRNRLTEMSLKIEKFARKAGENDQKAQDATNKITSLLTKTHEMERDINTLNDRTRAIENRIASLERDVSDGEQERKEARRRLREITAGIQKLEERWKREARPITTALEHMQAAFAAADTACKAEAGNARDAGRRYGAAQSQATGYHTHSETLALALQEG
ncbi:MAG: hypothetical protein K2Q10_01535, partial [Rhodospirillales bacterium]|nr:hypothetical protein [Rhodospirillales bacterium]